MWSAVTCYLVALRGERKKSDGEVGERPMISNKQACGVAVTTLVCLQRSAERLVHVARSEHTEQHHGNIVVCAPTSGGIVFVTFYLRNNDIRSYG